jgi:hypothetical protein
MSWEHRRKACEASGMWAVRFQGKPDPLPYILFLVESRCVLIGSELIQVNKIVIGNKSSFLCAITPNGPAIKGVSVAERMEAGAVSPNRGNVPAPAVMSEAWRGFCHPGTNFLVLRVSRYNAFCEQIIYPLT